MTLELCRICCNRSNLIDIDQQGGVGLMMKLVKCGFINTSQPDYLSKYICKQCIHMVEKAYELRIQSDLLKSNPSVHPQIQKKVENTEVLYISDDEPTNTVLIEKEKNCTSLQVGEIMDVDDEEESTRLSSISRAEEFSVIEPVVNFETRTESTVLASETEEVNEMESIFKDNRTESTILASEAEDVNEMESIFKDASPANANANQTFRTLSVDDIESSESYEMTVTRRYPANKSLDATQKASNAKENDVGVVEAEEDDVDIGEAHDEFFAADQIQKNEIPTQSLLSNASIDLVSEPDSPNPHSSNQEELELESPSSSSFPYTCSICNESFTMKKDYDIHIVKHGSTSFQCVKCSVNFATRFDLAMHEATHMVSGYYRCNYCNRRDNVSYNLRKHIKACHTKETNYQCDICHKSFSRATGLRRHVQAMHTNKKWHCKACGESFRSAPLLNAHKNSSECTAYVDKAKPPTLPPEYIVMNSINRYKCVHCNALFKNISIYKTHLLIHEDFRPFQCKICPKAFRTRYAMITHERIHNNEKPFKCDFCPKTFRQVTHLKHHRYQHMKETMPFKCTTCQLGFITKWKLRDHLRKHLTEQAYKCAECPEGFFLKYDLKKHSRQVHNRSVMFEDSDNEGNQNPGTTETDRTDDEQNSNREYKGEIVHLDDDDDYNEMESYAETSNSIQENVLVVNEAEQEDEDDEFYPAMICQTTDNAINVNYASYEQAEQEEAVANLMKINQETNTVKPETELSKMTISEMIASGNKTPKENVTEKIVDFIDLEEEEDVAAASVAQIENINSQTDSQSGATTTTITTQNLNQTTAPSIEVIELEDDDDDDNEEDIERQLMTHTIPIKSIDTTNTPLGNKIGANISNDRPEIVSSMIIKTANNQISSFVGNSAKVVASSKPFLENSTQFIENANPFMDSSTPITVVNEVISDYIHLDSSNSCHQPAQYNQDYYENVLGNNAEEVQAEYDTITEEKIEITEEKIETFTSYYQFGNVS